MKPKSLTLRFLGATGIELDCDKCGKHKLTNDSPCQSPQVAITFTENVDDPGVIAISAGGPQIKFRCACGNEIEMKLVTT